MDAGASGSSRAPRASTTSVGFVKADSSNLPHMDECMILEYMASSNKHNIAEIRGAKVLMSSRDSYLESAVGYVELQRTGQGQCIVRAKITPEHKIANKNYIVSVNLFERDNVIQDATCDGCAASAGGCKHTLVFLFWLSKRSNEPAPTSVQCYWKKPKLTSARSEPLEAENVFKNVRKMKILNKNPNILTKFKEECQNHNTEGSLILLFMGEKKMSFNLFDMTLEYVKNQGNLDFDNYKKDLDKKITPEIVQEINKLTVLQVNSKIWHSVRQGRITASKIYEAAQCSVDGSLVQQILGGYKVPETKAIKRGKQLEEKVIAQAEAIFHKKIKKSGFILISSLIGASPDGVAEDFVVEVKCPMTEKSVHTYLKNNIIQKKFAAQMQLQMLAANKQKSLFCVVDPSFETTKKIHHCWIDFDPVLTNALVEKSTKFWEKFIYNKMINSAL